MELDYILIKRIANIAYYILFFVGLAVAVFVVFFLIKNKEAFISNPFIYGAKNLGGDIECTCVKYNQNRQGGAIAMFGFNETTLYPIRYITDYHNLPNISFYKYNQS